MQTDHEEKFSKAIAAAIGLTTDDRVKECLKRRSVSPIQTGMYRLQNTAPISSYVAGFSLRPFELDFERSPENEPVQKCLTSGYTLTIEQIDKHTVEELAQEIVHFVSQCLQAV